MRSAGSTRPSARPARTRRSSRSPARGCGCSATPGWAGRSPAARSCGAGPCGCCSPARPRARRGRGLRGRRPRGRAWAVDIEIVADRRPLALVEHIRRARVVVGTSLHVRIVAAAYGVPRVSLSKPKPTRYAKLWDPRHAVRRGARPARRRGRGRDHAAAAPAAARRTPSGWPARRTRTSRRFPSSYSPGGDKTR